MHYVKQFKINDVETKQVACIELHGAPNAATEGAVGVLGIDMDSPSNQMYICPPKAHSMSRKSLRGYTPSVDQAPREATE